jgi:hypothetical protein
LKKCLVNKGMICSSSNHQFFFFFHAQYELQLLKSFKYFEPSQKGKLSSIFIQMEKYIKTLKH